MGYTWESLDADERAVVLMLARHQTEGLTAAAYRAALGEDLPPAARARLAALGYVLEIPGGDGEGGRLELADRGWRWLQETAERDDVPRLFPDADTTERLTWALFHRFAMWGKNNGHGTVGQMLWSVETQRNEDR